MKKAILYLFLISFLLQSCYSYKTIDLKTTKLIAGQKYKIAEDKKLTKVRLKSFTDSTATFAIENSVKEIALSKIKTIKTRKFSVIKTISLVPITAATVVALFVISDPKIGSGATMNSPN